MGWISDIGSGLIDDTLGTNIFGENSSDRAINAQRDASNQANQTLLEMYQGQREDLAPWRETGGRALEELEGNEFMDDWQQDPGYDFRLQEGMKALNASASAGGFSKSGRNMKELLRYGQDYGSQEYGNAYGREYNRLSQLAGLGGGAVDTGVKIAGQYGQNVSGNQIGMGNAIGSANIAQANRTSNLIGQGIQGIAASDERLKKNIEPVSKDEMDELKKTLRAFRYKYKDESYGKGEWIGVLAQDLEKSKIGKTLVVEDKDGFKQVDMNRVMFLFLASLAEG